MTSSTRFKKGEEILHSVSYCIVAFVLMSVSSAKYGTAWHIVSFVIYGSFFF